MIKNLRFTPGHVEISHRPLKTTRVMQDRGGRLVAAGPPIASGGGYKEIKTPVGYSEITIKKELFPHLFASLEWACLDYLNFTFLKYKQVQNQTVTVVPPCRNGMVMVECPGRFSCEGKAHLDTLDYETLIEDYRLLATKHYPEYRNLMSANFDAKLLNTLFLFIFDKLENKKTKLEPWARRALEIKRNA